MPVGQTFTHNEVVKLPSYITPQRGIVQLGMESFQYEGKHFVAVKLNTGEIVVLSAADLIKSPKHAECPSCKCINIDNVT